MLQNNIRVLGIDPGTVKMGLGIIEFSNSTYKVLGYHLLKMSSSEKLSSRIGKIFKTIQLCIKKYQVNVFAIEDIFTSINPRSALKLGQGRGAAIAAAVEQNLPVFDYTAKEIKIAVSGYGGADKQQVAKMVEILLGINNINQKDTTDALAVAICHIQNYKLKSIVEKSLSRSQQ